MIMEREKRKREKMGKETATSRWGLQRVGEREIKVGKERDKTVLTAQPRSGYLHWTRDDCSGDVSHSSNRCNGYQM